MPFAKQYLTIIMLGNVISHMYFGLNSIIRVSGNPKTAMGLTLFTVIANAILDPIFIFALGMGVRGAAVATVLCQMMALSYILWYFSRKDRVVHFGKRILGIDWKIARSSLAIGLGPFLMNSAACIVNLFINQQLRKYGGDLAYRRYGVANRISFFFLMIVMGLNQGMQPIAGYNSGQTIQPCVRFICLQPDGQLRFVYSASFFPNSFQTAVSIFTNDATLLAS